MTTSLAKCLSEDPAYMGSMPCSSYLAKAISFPGAEVSRTLIGQLIRLPSTVGRTVLGLARSLAVAANNS